MKRLCEFDLVYLGTPYSKYPAGLDAAFRDAAKLTGALLVAGVKVYSPIAHTHPIAMNANLDPYDHKIWLPSDAAIMGKADAMVVAMMPSWAYSFGIAHEINVFEAAKKPVFYLDPETMAVR